MKIVIFGASGKTGSLLLEESLAKGYKVTAYVRRVGSVLQQHTNLKVVIGNLNDTVRLKEALAGADACLSALGGGSLTKHSTEIIEGIELIIKLMEKEGIKRFIYLSSIGAGASRYFMGPVVRFLLADIFLKVPLADHTINEKHIMKSKLQWTLVRPGGLTDGSRTGNSYYGCEKTILKGSPKISRSNVASFIIGQISDTTYINKAVWLYEKP